MKRKLKVCFVPPMYYPVPAVRGGAVEGLIELFMKKNEIYGEIDLHVFSRYDEEAVKKASGYQNTIVHFIRFGNLWDKIQTHKLFIYLNKVWMKMFNKTIMDLSYCKRIYKIIQKEGYDLVIIEGGGDCYNYGYLAKKVPREKLAIHYHTYMEGDATLDKWFFSHICVSNYVARILTMNGKITKENVYVLPNCAERDLFANKSVDKEIERKKFGLKVEHYIYIFWGRLIPEKGVKELLEAFGRIAAEDRTAKLLIVGDAAFANKSETPYTRKLKELLELPIYKDSVIFTGFIPHDELYKVIKMSDVAVLPSVCNDASPLVVFEAFESEMPVITTCVGGIPEIANRSNSVVIEWTLDNYAEDMYEAMKKVREEDGLKEKLSKKAFLDVQEWSDTAYYKNYVSIMENLV